jgi:hypothetical protein
MGIVLSMIRVLGDVWFDRNSNGFSKVVEVSWQLLLWEMVHVGRYGNLCNRFSDGRSSLRIDSDLRLGLDPSPFRWLVTRLISVHSCA